MKQFTAVLLAVLVLVSQGCSTIVSSSNWPVTLQSNPSGQEVMVWHEGVEIHHGTTPLTVVLASGEGYFNPANYIVECNGTKAELNAGFNAWYCGNLVFGGLIGLLGVDPATGAMWRLPESFTVNASTPRDSQ